MRMPLAAALLLCSTVLASAQEAEKEFPAKLLGQALLPANTLVPAPADAPADLKVSGKFLTPGKRVEAVGTVMGASGGRPTGLFTPFAGSDFDPESIQPIGGKYWIGEEFGPYLLRVDADGKVEAVFETMVDGKPARSPDHFAVTTPGVPNQQVAFNVRRSKGFEGMAQSPDGRFLYPLLEGAFWDTAKNSFEEIDGKAVLRILEFDVQAEKWTGRSWFYPLEAKGNAIGDFNMIDATTGLIIERDDGEGTADKACPAGQRGPDCFHDIARFKRIVKIEMTDANAGKPVRKIGHIDLMNIKDPDGKAKQGTTNGVFTFPFFTIENVDVVDRANGIIVVGNDNNLPFSSSRDPKKADDEELVLLSVKELLEAR